MSDRTHIVATRALGGIAVTVYAGEGDVMRVILSPKRAALLGLDLLSLAVEPVFRAVAQQNPARDDPEPVNPPA
jgi:hypothetical protein